MRSALLLSAAILVVPMAAQSTPEGLLALVPSVPTAVCKARPTERAAFETRVNKVLATMDERISARKEKEDREGEASAKALEQKFTGGKPKATKADREKLKGMSKEEKMAWAMAQMQGMDPKAMQEVAQRNQGTQKALNLPKASRDRMARVAAMKEKFEALEAEAKALTGGSGGRDFSSQSRAVSPELCPKLTAKYVALLADNLAAIKAALPDYRTQAEAMAEAAGLPKAEATSTEAMQAIRDYTARVLDVYRYTTTTD